MKRREFITLIGSAAAAWPVVGRAQQPNHMKRIGVLMPFAANDPAMKRDLAVFVSNLQELGWTEGRNLKIDYRWAAGDAARIQEFAKELVSLQPDLLLCRSTPATAALLKQTRSIPIVLTVVSDPVGEHFVDSVPRPGGNATGFTNVEASLTGKWMELLKEVAPGIRRIAFIFNPNLAPGGGSYYTRLIEAAAPSFAVTPLAKPVHDAAEIERAIDEFAREPNGGLIVLPDATTNGQRKLIIAVAGRNRLPAIYEFRETAVDGGLISYGISVTDMFRRAAVYADRILRGVKPSELPVQLPIKYELVINLKTAKALGITIPTTLLTGADEVIE